uniref:DekiORF107 n=1 Tax=Dendrolimus kikuchii nucleopolyhedrovirus TaxID=1219875 RepID=V9LSS8_9ABAC|nr:DekiORF107 [Dendrolimus kikuchii nucleopolyhedrovirus]
MKIAGNNSIAFPLLAKVKPPPLYDIDMDAHGCTIFTVRRYNRRVIDFAGMRIKMLHTIRSHKGLPLNTPCVVRPVDSACMHCNRNFALYAAVTYLHCGHSCLCTECDEMHDSGVCPRCSTFVTYKLKYKTY